MSDHHKQMLDAAMEMERPKLSIVQPTDLKELLIKSVILAALENLMKLDTDQCLRAACRARYLDLTDGRLPQ